jgi:hypothetical protein
LAIHLVVYLLVLNVLSEDQLCRAIGDLGLPPRLILALQRFEVPLNAVHADRERFNPVEALGVLGQYRREHACDNIFKFRMP